MIPALTTAAPATPRAGAAPLRLADINAMDQPAFVAALGDIFEHSPWVAEQAWSARPFDDVDALHDAMMAVVRSATRTRQVAFLGLHPELAGAAVRGGTLTVDSTSEQRSAGLDAMSAADDARLREMNRRYQLRHGFPFIVCVRHYTQAGIFAELGRRIARDTEAELGEALAQVAFITRLRLAARVAESSD